MIASHRAIPTLSIAFFGLQLTLAVYLNKYTGAREPMKISRRFPILVKKLVDERTFVDFWSSTYEDPRAHLNSENISKPLTATRLLKLCEWKNGGLIAEHKPKSIRRHYIDVAPTPPEPENRESRIRFVTQSGESSDCIAIVRRPTLFSTSTCSVQ